MHSFPTTYTNIISEEYPFEENIISFVLHIKDIVLCRHLFQFNGVFIKTL